MSQSIVVRGIELNVSEESFDDFELFELLDDLDENPQKIVSVFKRLFSKEEYDAIKESLRDERGKVSVSSMMGFYTEVAEQVASAKN